MSHSGHHMQDAIGGSGSSASGSHHDLTSSHQAKSSIHDLKKEGSSFMVEEPGVKSASREGSRIDVGYPEGGAEAIRTTIGAFMTLFVQFGIMNSFGVFEAQYVRANLRSKSESDIAWIGTFQFFIFFFSTVRIVAGICAAILLPASALVRTRFPRRPFNRDISSLVDVEGFKDLGYILFLAASVITMLGTYNPYIFVTVYAESRGFGSTVSIYILSIMNAGSFFGRLIPGALADKLGFFNILSIALTVAAPILFCWLVVSSAAGFIVWAVFYGFFSGAFIALLPACIGKFTPDPTKYGGRAGMVFAFVGIAVLCGPPIAGALITRGHGNFDQMIVYSGVMCVAGAALYWVARFKATSGRLFVKF
ncbi:hypothetical protein PM082_013458 [Marasmius tenuissimus]|nr:hypothetical protein PM082_013458 [Marasmius tenuissimus]